MAGIYIHIPFCERKCFYCDFYSIGKASPDEIFVSNLLKEIDLFFDKNDARGFEADSLFFGGGTPSLLTPEQLNRILSKLNENIKFKPDYEFTLEANPNSMELNKLVEFKKAGVNRLSFGVQSFNEEELKFLQRIHSPGQAENAIRNAKKTGYDNVNLDLIISVPGQTQESLEFSLNKAMELETNHISVYSLMYEEGTPLYEQWKMGKVKKVDEELEADQYEYTQNFLQLNGFVQYEISNHAKNDKYCRHNLNYWDGSEYLAFGPSAHGYFSGRRYSNYRSLNKYNELLGKDVLPLENMEILNEKQQMEEAVFLGLRADGINLKRFKNKFGFDLLDKYNVYINDLKERELITISNTSIKLTAKGYIICDQITVDILDRLEKII